MKTAADIIKAARATAYEITTIQTSNTRSMNDATRCILEAGRAAKGTKNIDKLFVLAQNVTAAGRAALSINNKTWNDVSSAYEMAEKARRSASAYAAAEERARRAGNAAKIEQAAEKSAAAKQAAYIIGTAYKNANEVYSFHNREMNAALTVAASVIKRAKYADAADVAEAIAGKPVHYLHRHVVNLGTRKWSDYRPEYEESRTRGIILEGTASASGKSVNRTSIAFLIIVKG